MSYRLKKYTDADLDRMPAGLAAEIRRAKEESDDFDIDFFDIWQETDTILADKAEAALKAAAPVKAAMPAKAKKAVKVTKAPAKKPNGATAKLTGTKTKYSGVFGDYDGDGVLNVDDPNPTKAGDRETVEEVKLSDEIAAIIKYRDDIDDLRKEFVKLLEDKAKGEDEVYSRTKAPFSIINKLRRKRLVAEMQNGKLKTGPTGLTDIIGTMIVFPNQDRLEAFVKLVNAGAFGTVLEFDDYYAKPQAGYKAYHWNVVYKGVPVEIQAKTKRMYVIAHENHTLYKTGDQNASYLLALTDLMEHADKGEAWATSIIDPILTDPAKIRHYLTKEKIMFKRPASAAPKRTMRVVKKARPASAPKGDYQQKVADMRDRREAMLASTIKREDLGRLSMEQVLELAQKFNKLRLPHVSDKDSKGDSKQRISPTGINLIRWMKNPGNFDLIGLDTYRRNDPTANLRIKEQIWWNRLGL